MNRYKSYGKGWHFEGYRHSLAVKGIKTKFNYRVSMAVMTESEANRIKNAARKGLPKDIAKEMFPEIDVKDIDQLYDDLKTQRVMEEAGRASRATGKPIEVDGGVVSVGPFISTEIAEKAEAKRLREIGGAAISEITPASIRKIIRDAGFKHNPYAETYISGLDEAEAMYGTDGVKTQILYIISNLKAMTPEQKEAKKLLKQMAEK